MVSDTEKEEVESDTEPLSGETVVKEKPAAAASKAGGEGTTKGEKNTKGGGNLTPKGKAVVKKSRKRQIDELVQSDNEEEKQEDEDEAPAGLLTEIYAGPNVLVTDRSPLPPPYCL